MIYRGLYHFSVAHQKGLASDPVKYFAAPENKDLGIVKQKRKNNRKLIVAPFPEKQRNTPDFFFSPNSFPLARRFPSSHSDRMRERADRNFAHSLKS